MMTSPNQKRIVAFDVRPRTFGFAVFEGPNELLDFGARSFRNAERLRSREKLAAIFDDFDPTAVVLSERVSRRGKCTSKIGDAVQKEGLARGISVRFVTAPVVKRAFAGSHRNKYEIASVLAREFPALASKLPPKRKIWQREDYRMRIFGAAALGAAYSSRRVNETS